MRRKISNPLGTKRDQSIPLGGPGSGNWGHVGRPGSVGGSQPRSAGMTIGKGHDWLQRYKVKTGHDHPYKAVADQWKDELDAAREIATQNAGVRTATQVREALAKLEAPYRGELDELEPRLEELKKELDTLDNQYWRTPREERGELYGRIDETRRELVDIREKVEAHQRELNDALRSMLYVENPVDVSLTWGSKFSNSDPRKAAVDVGVSEFTKMVSSDVDLPSNATFVVRKGGRGRASADVEGVGINLTTHSDAETVIHELGHWLEANSPTLRERVHDFYARRTENSGLQSMNQATGGRGYSYREQTRVDRFLHPYMGKNYVSRATGERYATEILSMGLEMFYTDPRRLARQDPDYFDFVYSVVRGIEQ